MDIKNLNKQQYEHLFEIDKIKQALFVAILEHNKLIKNYHIPKSKLRRIEKLLKDFRIVCFKLIRCELDNTDDYSRYSKTLLIIISKIRTIIRSEKGIKDGFGKVYNLLPFSESKLQSFLNGYFTKIVIFVAELVLIVGVFATALSIKQHPSNHSVVILFVLCVSSILFPILRAILYRKIDDLFTLDRMQRTIDNNVYFDKRFDKEHGLELATKIRNLF